MRAATFFDGEGWRDGIVELVDGRMLLRDAAPNADLPRLDGVIVGGFTDHHVHLQLVDHTALHGSTLGRVIDLGASPTTIAALAADLGGVNSASANPGGVNKASETAVSPAFLTPADLGGAFSTPTDSPHPVDVAFAGAFLTPVGGYPSDRDWTPTGSFREIADDAAARAAVAEMTDAGASCIKVASNAAAGPVFDDDLFRAIVEAAAARRLPVVAHAEGAGQTQRVARLGAARLAHAPFTERLGDDEIAQQVASVSWISTLAIHNADSAERTTAVDNVRRFHAAGGTVLYGTDMGNGPTPVGLNAAEIAALHDAGLAGTALLRALDPQDPRDSATVLLRLPGPDADPTLARPLTSADLKA